MPASTSPARNRVFHSVDSVYPPQPCLLSHEELKPPDSWRLRRIGRPCHQAGRPPPPSYTPLPVRLLPDADCLYCLHAPVWSAPLLHYPLLGLIPYRCFGHAIWKRLHHNHPPCSESLLFVLVCS